MAQFFISIYTLETILFFRRWPRSLIAELVPFRRLLGSSAHVLRPTIALLGLGGVFVQVFKRRCGWCGRKEFPAIHSSSPLTSIEIARSRPPMRLPGLKQISVGHDLRSFFWLRRSCIPIIAIGCRLLLIRFPI